MAQLRHCLTALNLPVKPGEMGGGSDSFVSQSAFTFNSRFVSLPTAGEQPGPIPVPTSGLSNPRLG